jgi:alpha-beta hydrolase superfamily lysophospholipase
MNLPIPQSRYFWLSLVIVLAFVTSCRLFGDKRNQSRTTMADPKANLTAQAFRTIFFPRPDQPYGPEARGAFDHRFEVEKGVRLRMRFFLAGISDPVILFFHGNGETARDYDSSADDYRALPASLIVAEYRGYGGSGGEPSLETMLSDAQQELTETKKVLADKGYRGPMAVMGRSLGSAAAIELASSRASELSALIVESGFGEVLPLLALLGVRVEALSLNEDDGPRNLAKMAAVSMPTLILHAEQDDIISIKQAELLMAANKDPQKVFVRVPGAGHNDIQFVAGERYFATIRRLLNRVEIKK